MFQIGNFDKYDDKALETKLIFVRLFACFLFVTLSSFTDDFIYQKYFNLIILLYFIYNLTLWAYISMGQNSKPFVASVFIDIIIITLLIALRGGIKSDLYNIYFVVLAYIISKKQKHLIFSATILILLLYPAVSLLYTDMQSDSLYYILTKLWVRLSIILMAVYILFNIKIKMNYSNDIIHRAYEMALIDPLTKVYNRNMLDTLYEYRKSHPYCLSFAMIDIDDFKVINDSYGHQKGDDILSMLGDLIKKNIRTDYICIRYGGEEFLLAFKNTDNDTALKILERIKTAFSEHVFYYEGKPLYCTISVGLALGHESEATEAIISCADLALYQAKRNGKNNIITYGNAV